MRCASCPGHTARPGWILIITRPCAPKSSNHTFSFQRLASKAVKIGDLADWAPSPGHGAEHQLTGCPIGLLPLEELSAVPQSPLSLLVTCVMERGHAGSLAVWGQGRDPHDFPQHGNGRAGAQAQPP